MTAPNPQLKRCAIYTRKSSEEGLEQEFNSLHAQREACAAYITSQKHEGWQPIKVHYDDGGFTGGNMDRPGLKQLLDDIEAGKVNIVIVYKVDRLTRSLTDFAKIIERFDKQGVSFVSVTQQFNTTSSMGRLTLNVLLSFAQFEREVTGERIRDKIAASKKKGMWMGGFVPLGYDALEKKLVVNPQEAETVRYIFARYLELGCVRVLQEEITDRGIRSKVREKSEKFGNSVLSRGTLYNLLSNPIYIGQVRHKGTIHPGQHEPIIDLALWDQVQQRLTNQAPGKTGRPRKTAKSFLLGKLFDESGKCLTPSHAVKGECRYRYYVSHGLHTKTANHGWRLPAQEIEQIVILAIRRMLNDRDAVTTALQEAGIPVQQLDVAGCAIKSDKETTELLSKVLTRVDLRQDGLRIILSLASLLPPDIHSNTPITISRDIPIQMKRRGVEMQLVIDGAGPVRMDSTLIKALARAHAWYDDLISGREKSLVAIASREGSSKSYVRYVMKLVFLAPDVIEAIIAGQQPVDLTTDKLIKRTNLPLDWAEQRRELGFA